MPTEARCMRCKVKRVMASEAQITMKNDRPAVTGPCSTCGTKMFKILPGKAAPVVAPSA